jgi:aspartate aminotransferase
MIATAAGFRLAARFDEVGFSDIVNIRNRVMELRAQGANVYQFEGGEPFRPTPDHIKDAMAGALRDNKTRYAPSSGILELRQAIAEKIRTRNRIPAEVEHVVVVNGGMQGLFGAFQSVVNPGDEVLVFSPYWTPIKDLVAHCEGRIVLGSPQPRRPEQTVSQQRWRATSRPAPEPFTSTHRPILQALCLPAVKQRKSPASQSIAT